MKRGRIVSPMDVKRIIQDIHRLNFLSGESTNWIHVQGIIEEQLSCDDLCLTNTDLVRYTLIHPTNSTVMDKISRLSEEFFPRTYILETLTYNGVDYANSQTLTVPSIVNVELNIGFDDREYISNACDWVNSIINNQFPLIFYDDFTSVDRPEDSTFELVIRKLSSTNGVPGPSNRTYRWNNQGWYGTGTLEYPYLCPYVEV